MGTQSVPLYLHRLPANVTVAGTQTKQVLNTTSLWGGFFTTPNLRYTLFNFTLYPALALDLVSSGAGSIRLWVTVSGAPGTLNATVYDVSAAGQVAVVTTSTGVTNSTDPQTPYEVVIPFSLTHSFSQSSTIRLSLTATKIAQLYAYYDSALYPASVTLPVMNVPSVSLVELFDWTLNRETRFSLNWTEAQRVVFMNIHVADPFGAYNVANATVTIIGPGSVQVFSGPANAFSASPGAPEKLFGLNWPYLNTAHPGNYTVSILASDYAGNQATGSSAFKLVFTTPQPPVLQPPGPEAQPTLLYGLLGLGLGFGLLLFLLAFMLFRRRVKCPKCGTRVSNKLVQCPKCGSPLKTSG